MCKVPTVVELISRVGVGKASRLCVKIYKYVKVLKDSLIINPSSLLEPFLHSQQAYSSLFDEATSI